MTTQQKINAIREACIKANPEIVELKFGCLIEDGDGIEVFLRLGGDFGNEIMQVANPRTGETGGIFASYKKREDGESTLETVEDLIEAGDIKIIGRPIRLADVLLAMDKEVDGFAIGIDGRFIFGNEWVKTKDGNFAIIWNLRADDLKLQDPQTIDFIHQVLFP